MSTDVNHNLRRALAHLRAGEPRSTEALAREGLAQEPAHATWLGLLALALSADRRPGEALPIYQALIELEPDRAAHWSNLGNCLCELGREAEALVPLQRAVTLGADDAAVHFALARAHEVIGPARTGLAHIERALHYAPDDAEFRLLRAKFLNAIDEWDLARDEIDALLQQPLDTRQRIDLAYLLLRGGLYTEAQQLFTAVLGRAPNEIDARLGAIMTLERINRVDEAVQQRATMDTYLDDADRTRLREKILQIDARLASRRDDHPQARDLLQTLLADGLADPALRIALRFDLGAELDKCGEYAGAMAAFAQAHAERRALVNDDHPALSRGDSLYVALDQPPLRAPATVLAEDRHQDPVFVVGFPRSGTTLLEQLLDAHDGLASFDEQPFIQRLVKRLSARDDDLQRAIDTLTPPDQQQMRDGYFADIEQLLPDLGTRRPIDKNPLNLVRLSVAQPFFPRSRVILTIRHPCDVVLSCYMQHFRAPAFAVTFESLDACADMYDRVFSHWQQTRESFALPVCTLRYEDLVDDTEGESRRLFDFLELPWQPQLLEFTERARRKGAISTPSYTQVIEPVNNKAVGRWQRYRPYFSDTALARLSPWAEHFGYPPLRES